MSEATVNLRETKYKHAYFAELRLGTVTRIRSFDLKATVSFRTESGHVDRWNLIVGENATGKSTVLECIYGMRPVQEDWLDQEDWSEEPRYGAALFEFGRLMNSPLLADGQIGIEAFLHRVESGQDSRIAVTRSQSGGVGASIDYGIYVVAYTAARKIQTIDEASAEGIDLLSFLTTEPQHLRSPLDTLLKTDYLHRLHASPKPDFAKLSSIVQAILPIVSDVKAGVPNGRSDPGILFFDGARWLSASQIGYGYLSTLAWVLDFAFKLAEAFPDLEDPLQAPAVCLVDEIDLHLHPKWQRTIVQTLLDTFPNVQFIVTAHSPIMVQASAGHNIVLLRRNEATGFVDIVNDVDEIANWSLDQIVTSSLFGFASAQSPNHAERVRRQTELLAKVDRTDEEEEELQRLEESPGLPRGEGQEEVELNRRIAATLSRLQERLESR